MKHFKYLLVILLALLSACETVQKRIDKNLDVYITLPPETQKKIKAGKIDIGFDEKMVYMAWGSPADKMAITDKNGNQATWIYTSTRTETHYRDVRYYDESKQVCNSSGKCSTQGEWKTRREEYQTTYTEASHFVNFKNAKVEKFGNFPSGISYPLSRRHLDQYVYQVID